MPVPGSINDLSTTEASNSPPGGEATFPLLAKYLRTHASFIAALRDGKLNASAVSAFMLTVLDDPDLATLQTTLGIQSRYSPGEYVLRASTTAPAGTLATNGGTIGNASSGGTARANADTLALFTVLWDSTSNTDLVIQTSAGVNTARGASAAADFAANKRLPLPDLQDGEALVAAVSSAVGARTAGQNLSHTHAITVDAVGNHTHRQLGNVTSGSGTNGGGAFMGTNDVGIDTAPAGAHSHTASAASDGGTKNKAAGLYTRVYIAL